MRIQVENAPRLLPLATTSAPAVAAAGAAAVAAAAAASPLPLPVSIALRAADAAVAEGAEADAGAGEGGGAGVHVAWAAGAAAAAGADAGLAARVGPARDTLAPRGEPPPCTFFNPEVRCKYSSTSSFLPSEARAPTRLSTRSHISIEGRVLPGRGPSRF
jgi:hypothetical protein